MRIEIPENWYEVRHISDGVTHIQEPHIKPFYRCNIWHVTGRERDMLIDSGMGVVSLSEQFTKVTERPPIAVATHSHFDHIGSHHEFKDRAIHKAEAELMADPDRKSVLIDPFVSDDMFTALPPGDYNSERYEVVPAPATRLLEDGDIIDLGDRHFQVLHTPGHSPGSIALFEQATGVLFSGDAVYNGPLVEDAWHSSIDDYIASMERLLRLSVKVVHGGHFPSFGGERYRELILEFLHKHGHLKLSQQSILLDTSASLPS
ncbi:MAG: MBL fold metallo-hydrolase [Gammaproteobacteria bacterium]|nr:MBL fold metallo-hydrolase [Gammaproteobacteria bacterium]